MLIFIKALSSILHKTRGVPCVLSDFQRSLFLPLSGGRHKRNEGFSLASSRVSCHSFQVARMLVRRVFQNYTGARSATSGVLRSQVKGWSFATAHLVIVSCFVSSCLLTGRSSVATLHTIVTCGQTRIPMSLWRVSFNYVTGSVCECKLIGSFSFADPSQTRNKC